MMMKLYTMTSRKKLYSKLQEVISKRDGMAKFPSSVVEFSQNIIEEAVRGLEITELEYCWRPRTTVLGDLLLATGSPTKCERYPKGLEPIREVPIPDQCVGARRRSMRRIMARRT